MARANSKVLCLAALLGLSGCGSSDSNPLFHNGGSGGDTDAQVGSGGSSSSGKGGTPGSGGIGAGGSGAGGRMDASASGGSGVDASSGGVTGNTGGMEAGDAAAGGTQGDGGPSSGGSGDGSVGSGGTGPGPCTQNADCTTSAACRVAVCDVSTGTCVDVTASDGAACEDGDLCTLADTCQAGVCTAGSPVVCPASDACHSAGSCDPATGSCSDPPLPDGTLCDDGVLCTAADVCSSGVCGGTPVACDDGVTCTVDSCSETVGGCTADVSACTCAVDADCDDGNACDGIEICNLTTSRCENGTPVDCSSASDACNTGSCNPSTGACVATPKTNGTACDDGNACTQTDTCQSGSCTGVNPVVCPLADQCHGAGVCDVATGQCTDPPLPNGTACTDSDPCTQTDTCQSGVCLGTNPVVCAAQDQCHSAGICNPADGVCTNPAKVDGTACSDGDACTLSDTCQAGACTGGSPVVCTAQDQCHVAGTCDPSTGQCSNPPSPDGTTCSDGDACTQTDTCHSGICAGSNPVTCTAQDQCHAAGTCDPGTGRCTNPARADGTTCSDGNPCTQTDTCVSGACTGSNLVVCTAEDQCHTAGTCNPLDGLCTSPKKADGTVCDDGNACSQTDTCQSGTCKGANPVVCVAQDQCHVAGTCDPGTGQCSNPASPNGTLCDDGLVCTAGDACTGGVCGGKAVSCDDGIACTVDSCSESAGGCTADKTACGCAKDTDCNDGNACNGVETCNPATLTCKSGTPVDCSTLTDACNTGTCSPSTGACTAVPSANGTSCDDGNACTKADTCQKGTCTGGSTVACTALDQCHVAGTCNPVSGVCANPPKADGVACDDGNACTQTDTCQKGACTGAALVTCLAQDQCHVAGTCDPASGTCSNPAKKNGSICTDGDACTQTDTCQNGACTGANPVLCAAEDQCHVAGTCDPASGVCSNPAKVDNSPCSDGNACTQTDTCQKGACSGGNAVQCAALDQCHVAGTCSPNTGSCTNPTKPDGSLCDDGNLCSQTDTCQSGSCTGSNPVTCTALDQCHLAGTCAPATGKCSNPTKTNGASCDDGIGCTLSDGCQGGVCTGTDVCSVSIVPTTVSLLPSAPYAFSATVSGTANQTIAWSVQEGTPGGGVIDSAGNYLAPAALGTYHVVATSVADPNQSAIATVTVTSTPVTVSICPQTTTLWTDDTMDYTAMVAGTPNQAVTWSVSGGGGGGAIDVNGVFKPSGAGTYTIQAVSQAEPAKKATATATVVVQNQPSLSGKVTYGGSRKGRIYVIPRMFGGGATTMLAPGSYRIRNVQLPSGSITVMAYRDVLGVGTYVAGVDPLGTTTFAWTGTDPGNVDITLTDPSPPALVAPSSAVVVTGDGVAAVGSARIVDANNDELPDGYRVYVGLDAGVGPSSNIMVREYRAGGIGVGLVAPLTNGTQYYFAVAGVRGGVVGPTTTVGPYTVNPAPGGSTISGTVAFSGVTRTGPLWIFALPSSGLPRIARYTPGASATSQAYSVPGASDGIYQLVALFDQGDDGDVAPTDPGNFHAGSSPLVAVEGADLTAQDLVIPKADSLVHLTTMHDAFPGGESYGLRFRVAGNSRLVAKVALTSGAGLSAPTDLPTIDDRGNHGEFRWEAPSSPGVPTLGSAYTFDVTYDDGVTCSVSASVGAVLAGTPAPVSPIGTGTTVPTFVWLGPSPAPSAFTYSISVRPAASSGSSMWTYAMPSSQLSVLFDYDGSSSAPALSQGASYQWTIDAIDPAGNEARYRTLFTVPPP